MRTVLEHLLEMILPRRDAVRLVDSINSLVSSPQTVQLGELQIEYLFSYQDKSIRALITESKFHDYHHAQKLLAVALSSVCTPSHFDLIIPMPLSTIRHRERGFNQIERVLDRAKISYQNDILTRHHRPAQVGLDRTSRLNNMNEAFFCRPGTESRIVDQKILLIDDVVTTGATMAAARATLARHHPRSLHCLAFAH